MTRDDAKKVLGMYLRSTERRAQKTSGSRGQVQIVVEDWKDFHHDIMGIIDLIDPAPDAVSK